MKSRSMRAALAAVGAAAATVTGTVLVPSAASASSLSQAPYVSIVVGKYGVQVSDTSLPAGRTTFRMTTPYAAGPDGDTLGANIFQPKPGKTLQDFVTALQHEFSQDPKTAALGTRQLEAAVTVYGGAASIEKGNVVRSTFTLYPGTYYVESDEATQLPDAVKRVVAIHVYGSVANTPFPAIDGTVAMVGDERFSASPRQLPHDGTILVQNRTSDIHFMDLIPTTPDMTDTKVQQTFDAWMKGQNAPPPFTGPDVADGAMSPGIQNLFTYHLKPGRYIILCWVADAQSGMPHAFMGMHLIVDLK